MTLKQMTESELEQAKTWIKGLLNDSNIKDLCITFTKSDGTERKIRCTTVESSIPSDLVPKGTGRSSSDAVQRVFDLDKGEWRSFRWDRVKHISFKI